MAQGKDFRLTAVFSVRDAGSQVMEHLSAKWDGLRQTIESTDFSAMQKQARLFQRSVRNAGDAAADFAMTVGAPLTAAVAAAGFSLQQMVTGYAQTGDAIDKSAQRLGIGTAAFQELSYAARSAGAAPEDLEDALKDLGEHMAEISQGVDTSSDAFTLLQKLGIDLRDEAGNLRPVTDVFRELADAIQRNEDPSLRVKMALATMGDSGRRLLPALTGGSAGLDAMAARAHELGVVMSDDAVKGAADLTTSLTDFRMVVGSLGDRIGAALVPQVISITDRFRDMAVANKDAIPDKVSQAAESLGEALAQVDFEGLVSGLITAADWGIRAFNAIGGFNTVLYGLGAIAAGKTLMSLVTLGSSVVTMVQSFGALATAAKTVGVAMTAGMGPVGLAIAAVAAGAALVITYWDEISDVVGAAADWMDEKWEGAKAMGASAASWVSRKWDEAGNDIQSAVDGATAFASNAWEGLKKSCSDATGFIGQAWTGLQKMMDLGWDGTLKVIGDNFKAVFRGIDFSSLIPDWVKKFLPEDWLKSPATTATTPTTSTSSAPSTQMPSATTPTTSTSSAPSTQMPSATLPRVELGPVQTQQVAGTMTISVTATGGAAAAITDIDATDGLSIYGSVGQSGRSEGYYGY
ncbi:hypothetical protein [Sutterella sp.]|uniref:hypothetical protein n=1 Tax=Sutterella sp. TaxID=1981025 RepID=UPI0026E090D1|nr:hypothetical protein [Sutterella sp.]MDO5531426.1 hypothetical protein [Sutterella sp.]